MQRRRVVGVAVAAALAGSVVAFPGAASARGTLVAEPRSSGEGAGCPQTGTGIGEPEPGVCPAIQPRPATSGSITTGTSGSVGSGANTSASGSVGSGSSDPDPTGSGPSGSDSPGGADTSVSDSTGSGPSGSDAAGPNASDSGTTGSDSSGSGVSGAGEAAVVVGETVKAEEGVQVTFEQRGTGDGLDGEGIAFFLTDGPRVVETSGGYTLPGASQQVQFVSGTHGLGLHTFGDWEQRGYGCAQASPSGTVFLVPRSLELNAPGDGTTGYCWLSTSGGKATWSSSSGQALAPLVYLQADAAWAQSAVMSRIVRVTVTPSSVLTVEFDLQDGRGFQTALSTVLPTPLPRMYQVGFAGSAELFTDQQVIRHLVVSKMQTAQVQTTQVQTTQVQAQLQVPAQLLLPVQVQTQTHTQVQAAQVIQLPAQTESGQARAQSGLGLVKRVQRPTGPVEEGDSLSYTFRVTNTGAAALRSVAVTDPRITDVSCPADTLAAGAALTCTGTYTVTASDVAAGRVTNTATASAVRVDDESTVTSRPSSATVDLVRRPAAHGCKDKCDKPRFEICRDRPWYPNPCVDEPWHHGRPWHHGKPRHHHKPKHHHHKPKPKPTHHKPRPREKKPLL
ncbi:DUF11 domain-containing protein [Actinocorallia sp. API 0066]|uniref:DUF11 domain-containing protein n=1 Tax=Actinocorallia sp. API 0066 TaxID=2896846 RepID=UPI001E64D3A3|nr:DUF11 domain-containing protein [Actinocorallia sp. API 0066]MCD0453507.1 DUF11 domain-containing protein [Actinocorallia sp. API 0066]